jgi:hypothetical protein
MMQQPDIKILQRLQKRTPAANCDTLSFSSKRAVNIVD